MSALKIPIIFSLLLLLTAANGKALGQGAPPRPGLRVCVASNATPEILEAAKQLIAAVREHSLLSNMAGGVPPERLTDSGTLMSGSVFERAYNHLILIGLYEDPLIKTTWQREAVLSRESIDVFGFGNFQGSIGYIESDRNPFLHSSMIESTPFETEVVTLTGTTPEAVALSVQAFIKQKLIGGLVAFPGWKRYRTSLLKQPPLSPNFKLPDWVPVRIGDAGLIGVIQASDDEYKGVLADVGVSPVEIWRLKYYLSGAWDGAGPTYSVDQYSAGLHRRAYGNTLWMARFATSDQATQAAPKIAGAAKLRKQNNCWSGEQPPYAWNNKSPYPLTLWQKNEWLLMSTLPATPF